MDTTELLELWIDITGVDPRDTNRGYSIRMDGKLSNYDIKKMNDSIIDILKYDTDGVLTRIALRHYYEVYMQRRVVSLDDCIKNYDEFIKFVSNCNKLNSELSILTDSELEFLSMTDELASYYDITATGTPINKVFSMYKAYTCVDTLTVNQFRRGIRSPESPKYIKDINMVSSISKLISTINSIPHNVISLNYILDRDDVASSYFVFAIKNGDNIYLMNDKPKMSNPLEKFKRRTPGRDMERRIESSYFPYELANLELGKYYARDENFNKVGKDDAIILGRIADADYASGLWIAHMFNMIKTKIFGDYQCDELSYVGGMISHELLETSSNELVIYQNYPKLVLPIIPDPSDLDIKYDYESLGIYSHLVNRLKPLITDEMINLVNSASEETKYIAFKELELLDWMSNRQVNLTSLNVSEYGTESDLKYKAKWLARYNYALVIDALASQEYERERPKVLEFVKSAIKSNMDNVLRMIILDELHNKTMAYSDGFSRGTMSSTDDNSTISLVRRFTSMKAYYDRRSTSYIYFDRDDEYSYDCTSVLSGKLANIAFQVHPTNTRVLLQLTGLSVDELPEQIRDIDLSLPEPFRVGNSIISNVDPFDWVIKDRWRESLDLTFTVFLTKTEYNDLCKKYGIVSDKFWSINFEDRKQNTMYPDSYYE